MREPLAEPQGSLIVIKEDERTVHFLSILMLFFVVGGWAAIVAFVDLTKENMVAINVLGAAGTLIFLGMWIYQLRYPASLEISHEAITYKRRGRNRTKVIQRTTGDLAIEVRAVTVGDHAGVTQVLTIPGEGGTEIGVVGFERKELVRACEAVGWRFPQPSTAGSVAGGEGAH